MGQGRITSSAGGVSFDGPDAVKVYTATALAAGLRLWGQTGMKPNRAWTPKAMFAKAQEITGKRYTARRTSADQAAADLKAWADAMAAELREGPANER